MFFYKKIIWKLWNKYIKIYQKTLHLKVLHYQALCCIWNFYIPQGTELLLDVSGKQKLLQLLDLYIYTTGPELHLIIFRLQMPVPHRIKAAQACTSFGPVLHLDMTAPQGPELYSMSLDVSGQQLPGGRILGCRTQKWPWKNACGLGNQRPTKWPNSKVPNCGLILTIIGQKFAYIYFYLHFFRWFGGVAGLWPYFLAGLAQ